MNAYAQALLDAAYAAYRERRYGEAWTALGFAAGSGWRDVLTARFMAHLEDLRGDTEAAAGWLASAAAIDPDNASVHHQMGDALTKSGRIEAAERAYRRAIELDAGLTEAYGGLARVLHLQMREPEALNLAKQALERPNDLALAHRMMGTTLVWLNRHSEALAHFRAAQTASPDDAEARSHEGMALLALGELDAGWRLYDARRWTLDGESAFRDHAASMWRGNVDIAGQVILLHTEQGLGDAIHFVRYVPLLAALGAKVWLEVAASLKSLLASVQGIDGIVAYGEKQPDWTLHCPLMTLPLAFGSNLGNIPAKVPYLHADAAQVAAWRQRLGASSRRRIGLAWSGNPTQYDDRLRSMGLERLTPLLRRTDCEFHVVQTGVKAADAAVLAEFGVHDHSTELMEFTDTAALMASLDLVISVDSSPAHLAGALARPVWMLLAFCADWRWMCERSDTPWYPTMRLFRQPRPGDWDAVVAEVNRALDALG